jgi:hypothetical protein
MKYTCSDEEFIEIVKSSFSISEVLKKLNHATSGGSYRSFYIRIKKLNINTSHFIGKNFLKGKTHNWSKKINLVDFLVENSNRALTTSYKKRLFKENLLKKFV